MVNGIMLLNQENARKNRSCKSNYCAPPNLVNSYIITKWKVLVRGRYFWKRSIGSSTIAEALYSLIAVVMIKFGSLPSRDLLKIIITIYLVKVLTTLVFAMPSQWFVNYFKRRIGIDVYEAPITFSGDRFKRIKGWIFNVYWGGSF